MPGTIRDFITKAAESGISADEVRSTFEDEYGVPLDSFKGKLDTELRSITPKRAEPTARGLMYQEPPTPAVFAPEEPKVPETTKPATTAYKPEVPIEEKYPIAYPAVAGAHAVKTLGGGPVAQMLGAGIAATPGLLEKAAKTEFPWEQPSYDLMETVEKAQRMIGRPPIDETQAPTPRQMEAINQSRAQRGLKPIHAGTHPLTARDEMRALETGKFGEVSEQDIKDLNRSRTERNLAPLNPNTDKSQIDLELRQLRREEQKKEVVEKPEPQRPEEGALGLPETAAVPAKETQTRGQVYVPTPKDVKAESFSLERLGRLPGGAAMKALGDTALTRALTGVDVSPRIAEALGHKEEQEAVKKQYRSAGIPVEKPKDLPWLFETKGSSLELRPEPGRYGQLKKELPAGLGWLVDLPSFGMEAMWEEQYKKDPALLAKSEADWKALHEKRKELGLQENAFTALAPDRWLPTLKEMSEERHKRRVRSVGDLVRNTSMSLGEMVLGVYNVLHEAVGTKMVPEDQRPAETGLLLGQQLGLAPAQVLSTLDGMTRLDSENPLITDFANTWLNVVHPGILLAQKTGATAAAKAAILATKDFVTPPVSWVVDKAFEIAPKPLIKAGRAIGEEASQFAKDANEFRVAIKRVLEDGFLQADKRATAIVEQMLNGRIPDYIQANINLILRQIEQGKVRLKDVDLEKVLFSATPGEDVAATSAAARVAGKAEEVAGKAAGRADMLRTLRQKTIEDSRAVRELKKQANALQERIAKATTEVEAIELKKRLADLKNEILVKQNRLANEARESRFRGRAEKISQEAGEAGVGLAEGVQSVEIPKRKPGSVPFMMTRAMEKELKNLGFPQEVIDRTKPGEAWDIIEKKTKFEDYTPMKPEEIPQPSAKEQMRGVKREAKVTDREIMQGLAEAERLHAAADEARQRGIREEDVIRERADRIRATLEERQRALAGTAAAEGVRLADSVKRLDQETAAGMASEAAAAQARVAAGAARTAKAAAGRVETAGVLPEVRLGEMYVPPEVAAPGRLSEADLRKAVEEAKTPEELQRATDALQARIEGREAPQVSQEKLRQASEQARSNTASAIKAFDEAQAELRDRVKRWNENYRKGKVTVADEQAVRSQQAKLVQMEENIGKAQQAEIEALSEYRKTLAPTAEGVTRELRAIDPRAREYMDRLVTEARGQVFDAEQALKEASPSAKADAQAALDRAQARLDAVEKAAEEGRRGAYRVLPEGGPKNIRQILDELPKHRRDILEANILDASKRKKTALEAGFDAEAVLPPDVAKRFRLPEGASAYDLARKYAEYLTEQNVENIPALVETFLRQNGIVKGGLEAGRWLESEVQAAKSLRYLTEPLYKAVPRPTPVVETFGLTKEGKLLERPESARAQAAAPVAETVEAALEDKARRHGERMMDRAIEPEAPVSFQTDNEIVNRSLGNIADAVRSAGYGHEFGWETPQEPIPVEMADPNNIMVRMRDRMKKELSEERIQYRVMEGLIADSTQKLRDVKYQSKALEMFRKRAEEAGLKGSALNEAVAEFNKLMNDPERISGHGKNKFFRMTDEWTGSRKVLWDREDFAKVLEEMNPKARRMAEMRVIEDVGNKMKNDAAAYSMVNSMINELNRFRTVGTINNVAEYARNVAEGVIFEGKLMPQLMPFSGLQVATQLREMAKKAEFEGKISRKLNALADELATFEDAQKVSGFEKQIANYWRQTFDGTEQPPNFHNVYIKPSVASSMEGQFAVMQGMQDVQALGRFFLELSKRARSGVVAENLRSLVNNDLANLVVQLVRRADPMMFVNLVKVPFKYKQFLDGDYGALNPKELRMYRAIAETNLADNNLVSQQIGKTRLAEAAAEALPKGAAQKISDIDAMFRSKGWNMRRPIEGLSAGQQFLRENYQKLGDVPFRLEEAAHVWETLDDSVNRLSPNTYIELEPVLGREIRLFKRPDGTIEILKQTGRKGEFQSVGTGLRVGLESPELARIYAETANTIQARIFQDPSRIGNWAKWLKHPALVHQTGIFSWQFKAMDIPGLKQGIVYEMLSGTPTFKTSDPVLRSIQQSNRLKMLTRRAMLNGMAQSALQDQRAVRDLRKSFGFDDELESAILAPNAHPGYVSMVDASQVMSTQPTTVLLGGLENLARRVEFGNLTDPQVFLDMERSRLPFETYNEEQWRQLEKQDPAAAKYGRELMQMKRDRPKDYEDLIKRREDYLRFAKGGIFNPSKFISMMGISGSPLAEFIQNIKDRKVRGHSYTTEQALRDFSKMMIGATPTSIGDIAATGAMMAGVPGLEFFSSYGDEQFKRGFFGGNAAQPINEEEAASWAVNQLLGIGYQSLYYGGGNLKDPVTGKEFYSRAKAWLKATKDALTESLDKDTADKLREAQKRGDQKMVRELSATHDLVLKKIRLETEKYGEALDKQYKLLQRGRKQEEGGAERAINEMIEESPEWKAEKDAQKLIQQKP